MTFSKPAVLAVGSASADDEAEPQAILKEAEDILNSVYIAHNHFRLA